MSAVDEGPSGRRLQLATYGQTKTRRLGAFGFEVVICHNTIARHIYFNAATAYLIVWTLRCGVATIADIPAFCADLTKAPTNLLIYSPVHAQGTHWYWTTEREIIPACQDNCDLYTTYGADSFQVKSREYKSDPRKLGSPVHSSRAQGRLGARVSSTFHFSVLLPPVSTPSSAGGPATVTPRGVWRMASQAIVCITFRGAP